MSFIDRLFKHVLEGSDKVAVSWNDHFLTYSDLNHLSHTVGNALARRGFRAGLRVGVLFDNPPTFIVNCLAVWRGGGAVVTLEATGSAQDYSIKQSATRFGHLLCHDGDTCPDIDGVIAIATGATAREGAAAVPGLADHSGNEDFLIVFSSGTTGEPKGICHTRRSIADIVERDILSQEITHADTLLATLPFHSSFGMFSQFLSPIVVGAGIRIVSPFAPKKAMHAIENNGITRIVAVPAIVKLLASQASSPVRSGLKSAVVSSAMLSEKDGDRFQSAFGLIPRQGYGMSETGRISCASVAPTRFRQGYVGEPLVDIRIFDDTGHIQDRGVAGEVGIRSEGLSRDHYLISQGRTEPIPTVDGFFLTGDIGHLDDAGSLFLIGRKKSLINTTRGKVSPAEIESAILGLAGILDVAVMPVQGKAGGETIHAFIVKNDERITKSAVLGHCASVLPAYKRPKYISFIDNIPRNSLGKAMLAELGKSLSETTERA